MNPFAAQQRAAVQQREADKTNARMQLIEMLAVLLIVLATTYGGAAIWNNAIERQAACEVADQKWELRQ